MIFCRFSMYVNAEIYWNAFERELKLQEQKFLIEPLIRI